MDISIDIDAGPTTPDHKGHSRGWRAALTLEPETRRVRLFTSIGPGTPAIVWHRRAARITVGNAVDGAAIEAALSANIALVEALFGAYLGEEWDGHNHVGQWTEDAEDAEEAIRALLADLPPYWSASEWLGVDPARCEDEVRAAGPDGLDALAASIVREGEREGALLDVGDVREALDWYAARSAEKGAVAS